MEWVSTETLRQILQIGGVSGMLVFALYGMIKTFSNTFAKKDEKFADIIAANNNQFMQFIERERIQHNAVTQKSIEALTMIQQELSKKSALYQKHIEVIDKLSENISKLEHRAEMHYAEIKAQQAELMMSIGKMMQRIKE